MIRECNAVFPRGAGARIGSGGAGGGDGSRMVAARWGGDYDDDDESGTSGRQAGKSAR